MYDYERERLSPTERRELEDREQIERLAKLLRPELLEKIRTIPYSDRRSLEKMSEDEEARIKEWSAVLPIDKDSIVELCKILNAKTPDVQALAAACAKHGLPPSLMGLLVALFSEAKFVGIAEVMSGRGKTKRKKPSEQKVKMGIRWLILEHEDPKKYGIKAKVALQLAEEFDLTESYVARLLRPRNRDQNTALFPDGVEAARQAAGLPPRF